jgi:hypothetical protein
MCLLLIGTVSPAIADLDGIQIISEDYHVSGNYETFPEHYTDSYYLYSNNSSGISGSISFGGSFAESSAGRFFANARASDNGNDRSFATALVSFQPETSGWLHAECYAGSFWRWAGHVTLSDSTAGVPLLDFYCGDWPKTDHGDWCVDGTHTYSLSLSAFCSGGDAAWTSANLSFIPEPASAILIGVGCLFARLKRR